MLNKLDYLLICLSEECAELQKEISKALRFGMDDFNPNDITKISNAERIRREIIDIETLVGMLADETKKYLWGTPQEKDIKRRKVEIYMKYSCKLKKLKAKS
jgi:hypothetical protein